MDEVVDSAPSVAVKMPAIDHLSTPAIRAVDRTRVLFSRPADLPGVEIMRIDDCERKWRVFHSEYAVCTVTRSEGVSEWCYRRHRYTSRARSLMLVEPGEVHFNTKVTEPGWFWVVTVAPETMATFAQAAGVDRLPHISVPCSSDHRLFRAFVRFHLACENGAPLLERESRLGQCMALVLNECCESAPQPQPAVARYALRRAHDYLNDCWSQEVSLADLARIAGLSRFHFLCAFQREFALPPHAYQISVRVERVRQLLRAGMPAADIDAGFADQSHLIRHFKRVWGVTPAQYAVMVGARPCLFRDGREAPHGAVAST